MTPHNKPLQPTVNEKGSNAVSVTREGGRDYYVSAMLSRIVRHNQRSWLFSGAICRRISS